MMKKTLLFLFTLLNCFAFAQVPQGMSYQAVAFDSGGNPVTNGNVGVRISILDNSATGTAVYSETHTESTNAQGLFNLNIGQGSATTGNFSAINWGVNSKFIKVEVDPSGGTNYTNIGTNQLMSVPYALYAEKSNQSGLLDINSEIVDAKSANFAFEAFTDDIVHVYNSNTGTWSSMSYNSSDNGSASDIIESKGNFAFEAFTDDIVHVYNSNTGTWSSMSYNSSDNGSAGEIVASNGNFAFEAFTDDIVHVYNSTTGTWSSMSYNSSDNGSASDIIESKGNFAFEAFTDDIVHVYNSNTGTWSSQSYNGSAGEIVVGNGHFAFNATSDDIIHIYSSNTGTWSSQSYNGTSGSIKVSKIE